MRARRCRFLRIALLLPLLVTSCGSILQGPILGSTDFERPSDAADAVVFLRCRGAGIHGEIRTDAEDTRVRADGSFLFVGSLTFPTTERCYLEVRHPRYLTERIELGDELVDKPDTIRLQSWDDFLEAGPSYAINPGTHRPWPESEFRLHLIDTGMWLRSFTPVQQREMAHYVPDLHRIYLRVVSALGPGNASQAKFVQDIARIEETTGYPFPLRKYREAIQSGDASMVKAFIEGGVLRDSRMRERGDMYLAAAAGQPGVMQVLQNHGEPVDAAGCAAPLLGALQGRHWQAALFLIRAGAGTDTVCKNRRPLGDAMGGFARAANASTLREFLAAGVPVDLRNSRGLTPLAEAVSAGKIEPVKLLLAAGADPAVATQEGDLLIDHSEAAGYLDILRELRLATSGTTGVHPDDSQPGEYFPLPWRRVPGTAVRSPVSFRWVNQLSPDPESPGVLWLATDGGLVRIAPAREEMRAWTTEAGLPTSRVGDLWFDAAGGYLWLSTSGGLARMPLAHMDHVETVGRGGPFSGYASAFLRQDEDGALWFVNGEGLYRLQVEQAEGRHFSFARAIFGAVAIPGTPDFFLADDASLLRFSPITGEARQVLDAERLVPLVPDGPSGLPQIRTLTVDEARRQLWIGTFRHGVFRLDLAGGTVSRPDLTPEQVATCARTTVTPHMHGETTIVRGTAFVQLERCFGVVEEDNSYRVMRGRIDAGPAADVAGAIWYLAGDRLYRLGRDGVEESFPSGRDLP